MCRACPYKNLTIGTHPYNDGYQLLFQEYGLGRGNQAPTDILVPGIYTGD
jgi:hypothetical protein